MLTLKIGYCFLYIGFILPIRNPFFIFVSQMRKTHHIARLLLADDTYFEGEAIGKIGTTWGEICFNTGMTGYQEVFTDPSYFGQITVMTSPHIGNYGVASYEQESSSIKIKGLVTKSFSQIYSREGATGSLQQYFEDAGIVGISGIDTRQLVRHIRNKGAMNAVISSEEHSIDDLKAMLKDTPSMQGLELSSKVTTTDSYTVGNGALKVAVLDLGVKQNIINSLVERGCTCNVYPSHTTFEVLKEWNPDGYFLSNGPGDPAAMAEVVEEVKNIITKGDKPVFGICLGHQMVAEANGISTYKMHNGHRGLNHPVKNLITGKSEITSQNHGFSVKKEDLEGHPELEMTHVNLNDDTVEGMRMKSKPVFSVQYHPEANPGPHDSRYLFDNFVAMMQKK